MLKKFICNSRQRIQSFLSVPKRNFSKYNEEYFATNYEITLQMREVLKKEYTFKTGEKESKITIYGIPNIIHTHDESLHDQIVDECIISNPSTANVINVDPTSFMQLTRTIAKTLDREKDTPMTDLPEHWDPVFPYALDELILDNTLVHSIMKDPVFKPNNLDEASKARILELVRDITDPEARVKEQQRVTKFIQLLHKLLIQEDGQPQPYDFYSLVYATLSSEHSVIFGGLPKILHRMICGNNVSTENLKDCFKNVILSLDEMKSGNPNASLYDIADFFYPQLFQLPIFLYQSLLLKSLAENNRNVKMFTGIHHAVPLFDMLGEQHLPANHFDDLLCLPTRMTVDTVDDLIEKYAILDALHEDNLWSQPYITNKFPYLTPDEQKTFGEVELQKRFKDKFKMYEQLKKQATQM